MMPLYQKEQQSYTMSRNQTNQANKFLGSTIDQYELGRTVGEGTFGKVRLAKHKLTQQLVAIKIMYKERITDLEELNNVTRQIAILKSISHPNTVKLYEIIQSQTELFLVMEYVQTDLMEYIESREKIDEADAARILLQILTGIEYLHSIGIAHRDLKPHNILLTKDKVVKIVDFGLSNMYKIGNKLQSPVGSPCYAAPQLIQGKSYSPLDIDIWSFGIIMYVLLTGYLPFNNKNVHELYKSILAVKYDIPELVSKLAKDLLRNILVIPAAKRFKTKQIKTHPWMYCHTKNFEVPQMPDWKHREQLVLNILQRQGFNKEEVETNIEKRKHNKITTLFNLYQRKGTFKLEQMVETRIDDATGPKTSRKIVRRPGLTPTSTNSRLRSATPKDRSLHSFETYVKIDNQMNTSYKVQTSKASKFIPSSTLTPRTPRKSISSIAGYSFVKRTTHDLQQYFGPYCLDGVFSMPPEKLKSSLLSFFKKERVPIEQVQPWKFETRPNKKQNKMAFVINNLNGIKDTLLLRVIDDGPEEVKRQLLAYLHKEQTKQ